MQGDPAATIEVNNGLKVSAIHDSSFEIYVVCGACFMGKRLLFRYWESTGLGSSEYRRSLSQCSVVTLTASG